MFRYFEAAKLKQKIGRMDEALRYAKEGLQIDRDCLGSDHALYEQGVETVQSLKMQV